MKTSPSEYWLDHDAHVIGSSNCSLENTEPPEKNINQNQPNFIIKTFAVNWQIRLNKSMQFLKIIKIPVLKLEYENEAIYMAVI